MRESDSKTGRYAISCELRRESTTVVHRAHDTVEDRDVALYTIAFADDLVPYEREAVRRRLLRRGEAVVRLGHPGIAEVYEVEEGRDETAPRVAMEFVDGPSLDELIEREGALKADWAFSLADTLADALGAAHEAGVTLRDLEPADIFVRESDGAPKIVDVGLEAAAQDTQPEANSGGSIYMAPECAAGGTADLRSELFSLGAILYETLCGKHPFAGDDGQAVRESLVAGELRSIHEQADDMSPELDSFFERALALRPEDRFPDAAAFREALAQAREAQRCFREGVAYTPSTPAPDLPQYEMIVDEAPVDEAPVDEAPVDEALVDEAPVDEALVDDTPIDEAPIDDTVGLPLAIESRPTSVVQDWPSIAAEPAPAIETATAVARTAPVAGAVNVRLWAAAVAVLVLLVGFTAAWNFRGIEPQTPAAAAPAVELPVRSRVEAPAAMSADPFAEITEAMGLTEGPEIIEPPAAPPAVVEPTPPPVKKKARPKPAAPKAVAAATPVRPQPVAPKPAAAAPAAPALEPATLAIAVKSSVRSGTLTLYVDGREVYSAELSSETKGVSRIYRKARGRADQQLDAGVQIPPGTHSIVGRLQTPRGEYEDRLAVEIGAGQSRSVEVVAGRGLRKRLTLKLD